MYLKLCKCLVIQNTIIVMATIFLNYFHNTKIIPNIYSKPLKEHNNKRLNEKFIEYVEKVI